MSVQNINEIINELENQTLKPEIIQDNKLHFTVDNKIYRVRMPSQREMLEADKNKNAYQIMLINSDDTMTLKKLKKVLKDKQDVDIDVMEKELRFTETKILKVYDKLVKRPETDLEGIEEDKKALEDIRKEREDFITEISKYTSPAIEIQSENYYMAYLTSICTELNVETETGIEWKKAWLTFDSYLDTEDSNLKLFAMGYLTTLIIKVRQ